MGVNQWSSERPAGPLGARGEPVIIKMEMENGIVMLDALPKDFMLDDASICIFCQTCGVDGRTTRV